MSQTMTICLFRSVLKYFLKILLKMSCIRYIFICVFVYESTKILEGRIDYPRNSTPSDDTLRGEILWNLLESKMNLNIEFSLFISFGATWMCFVFHFFFRSSIRYFNFVAICLKLYSYFY